MVESNAVTSHSETSGTDRDTRFRRPEDAEFWRIADAYQDFYRKYQLVCSMRDLGDVERAERCLSMYLRIHQDSIDLSPKSELWQMLREFNSRLLDSGDGSRSSSIVKSPLPRQVTAWRMEPQGDVSTALRLEGHNLPEEQWYQNPRAAVVDLFSTSETHLTLRFDADSYPTPPHSAVRNLGMLINVFPYSHPIQYLDADPTTPDAYKWKESTIFDQLQEAGTLLKNYEAVDGYDSRIRDWR